MRTSTIQAIYRLLGWRYSLMIQDQSETGQCFDSFGLLEHILEYSTVSDLLTAASVSQRWNEAARSDILWKGLCQEIWAHKWCMTHVPDDASAELPLFWRSYLTRREIQNLSLEQLRAFYRHPLLNMDASDLDLNPQLEKSMMQGALQLYMTTLESRYIRDCCWYASYSASVFDSKRSEILDSEVCSPRGWDTYFKIDPADVNDQDFLANLVPFEDDDTVLLYPHSICYFHENRDFTMELKEADLRHTTDLKWVNDGGHAIRVGPYPPLVATRKDDWGWKLENLHVVLYTRDL
jgi:hypothetical protein